ncbi:MAG: pantoate--beta-alanine ligase [Bdellovibrio sp.]|nr:MAG: pantoate--beta-alanine ligase [Bdellovibrio sp.]
MEIFNSLKEWRKQRPQIKGLVGFVPTMGALHQGHLSLVQRSLEETDQTVVSIFVNPTQFDDPKDLDKYPRLLEKDTELLEEAGVSFLLLPSFEEIYQDQYRFRVQEKDLSQRFCGKFRPGHFDGVLTVVLKLLNLVKPHKAFFGEKDYQQYLLIRDMVKAFFLDVDVVSVPIVREKDGLAMSSRNLRLSPQEREKAPLFYKILKQAPSTEAAVKELENVGFRVDYVEDFEGRRLGAVYLGEIRLIDNVPLKGVS